MSLRAPRFVKRQKRNLIVVLYIINTNNIPEHYCRNTDQYLE